MRVMEEDRGAVIASVVVVVMAAGGKENGLGAERATTAACATRPRHPKSGASGSVRLGRGYLNSRAANDWV